MQRFFSTLTLHVARSRVAVALALALFAGVAVAQPEYEIADVSTLPLLLAQVSTTTCNQGISSSAANLLLTQALLKHREAAALPVEERPQLYVEVLALLDRIVSDYGHTDLACRIIAEGPVGRMNVAEMRRAVGETSQEKVRYPLVGDSPKVSSSFYDKTYPDSWDPPAQHLGLDFPAPLGTTVMSPVRGTVVSNNTSVAEPFNKRVVILDEATGYEHVLGHLVSSVASGQAVEMGDPLGEIVEAGTGPHVHWGVNVYGVEAAIDVPRGWGWGRAPASSTREQAQARGWIDPLALGAEAVALHSSDGDVARQPSGPLNTEPAASTDDARLPRSTNLKSQFPETYAAIWDIPTVSNVAKETAITALEGVVTLAYSAEMNDLMWSRLGVVPTDLIGWATKNPERAVTLSLESVGANLAVSAAASVSAALMADSLFAIQPMASVPQSWQNPLKALVRATIVEVSGLARSAANPAAVVSPLVNRLIDVVEIYKATSALTRVVDEALVATALGLETSAQLAVDYPDPRSQRVAEATVADLLGRVREFVGEDDEAAVREIGDLTYTALISQRRGDLQTARELVEQIQREGKLNTNTHPFSAITKPVDWLTVVARGGRDTPEQAANVMIAATPLRDLLIESSAKWAHRDEPDLIVLPGGRNAEFSLESNGAAYYKDQQLFGRWQPGNGSEFQLHVFRAPGGKTAVVLYFHPDFRAMRIGIVDMLATQVLNNKVEAFARWGPSELSFSPDGAYVALAFPTGEFTVELGVFETATGQFALHQTKSPEPKFFFTPDLKSLEFQERNFLSLRQILWGYDQYGVPTELAGGAALIWIPELFAKTADRGQKFSLVGRWYDGGPGCASILKGSSIRHYILRTWYCEASESDAKPLIVEHDATVNAYVNELTGLSLRLIQNGKLEISAKGNVRDRLGESAYLSEEIVVFNKQE